IIENDERSVAAELERKFFDGAGALGHQNFADFGGPSERKFFDDGIGTKFAADFFCRAGNDVEDAFGDASPLSEFGESEGGIRSLSGGLENDGAAGSKGRAGFAGYHGERKIPRRDAGDDTNRLLDDDDALVGLMAGNGVAVDALGFFAE